MKKILIILLLNCLFACSKTNDNYLELEVSGISMVPTYKDGAIVTYDSAYPFEKLNPGDVIVLDLKRMSDYLEKEPKLSIKRVIGLSGDIIEVLNNKLYINSEEISNDYLIGYDFGSFDKIVVVPENHVFVLGDNSQMSMDSRTEGTYSSSYYYGLVINKK